MTSACSFIVTRTVDEGHIDLPCGRPGRYVARNPRGDDLTWCQRHATTARVTTAEQQGYRVEELAIAV